MGTKDLCPCGSGKKRQHCCGDRLKTSAKLKQVIIWSGIFLVAGVLTAGALTLKDSDPVTDSVTVPEISAVNRAPQPWEYNSITNQHWDPSPGHEHWHAGPPPSNTANASGGLAANPVISSSQDSGGVIRQHLEYDAATNRHWFAGAGHDHWHDGPPAATPSVSSSGSTTITPTPIDASQLPGNIGRLHLEYDAVNNRHWFAGSGHNHWHDGPPPK